jgi:hypothetical protein
MTRKNDSHRYVGPSSERAGWDVVCAPEVVQGPGDGEIRIASKQGGFIGSDIASGPRHRELPAKDRE